MSGATHSRPRTRPGSWNGIFACSSHSVLTSVRSYGIRTFSGFTPAASTPLGAGPAAGDEAGDEAPGLDAGPLGFGVTGVGLVTPGAAVPLDDFDEENGKTLVMPAAIR